MSSILYRKINYLYFITHTIELDFFVMSFDQDDDITAKVDHVGLMKPGLNDRCGFTTATSSAVSAAAAAASGSFSFRRR